MDNTQLSARDGSWFLFGDWQGVTRLALPGDKVKTNCDLDRPNETKPLVLRQNGMVWLRYGDDVDPVTLKKVSPTERGHDSPDPLGGPELAVDHAGAKITVRGVELAFEPSGDELPLGGAVGRRLAYASAAYQVFDDGSLVIFGTVDKTVVVTHVVREPDGAARVAFCRSVARLPHGDPDAFVRDGTVLLADRDLERDVGWLVTIDPTGQSTVAKTAAVAGPWVHDGKLWWQPDGATLCAGDTLGEPTEQFDLPEEHAGAGRLLRLPGRKLLLPWHGACVLDLAPAKKNKTELSRKHKAADEPMYRKAADLLRPIADGMARRGVRVRWLGVVRRGKYVEARVAIHGPCDVVTYALARALQNGCRALLEPSGVRSVSVLGGTSFDDILDPAHAVGATDIRALVRLLEAAGINPASGLGGLQSLDRVAAERNKPIPWTPEAMEVAVGAVLAGLRSEPGPSVVPVRAEAYAEAPARLSDYEGMRKHGVDASSTGMFLAVDAHRRFGADTAAPLATMLEKLNPTYRNDYEGAVGLPITPYVPPVVEEEPLSDQESRVVGELETVLGRDLGLDAPACREGRAWYRFAAGGHPLQAGIIDDLRVTGTLCKVSINANLGKLIAALKRANPKGARARFFESDGYIHVKAGCPVAEADAASIKSLLDACIERLDSAEAGSLKATYKSEW